MDRDYRKELERDIDKFEIYGQLPKERDVRNCGEGGSRDYWDWLAIKGGGEPLWNSGESEAALETEEDAPRSSNYEAKFREWMDIELPQMAEEDQELFYRAYEQGMNQTALATYFNVSQPAIHKRLLKIRESLAEYLGIVNF